MNFKKKLLIIISFLIMLFPFSVYAYSDKVILGGDNIGISVNIKEILVVGFYKVNDKYIASEAGFAIGDKIIKVNNNEVNNIESLVKEIKNNDGETVAITVLRDNEEKEFNLTLVKDGDNYKTGLYIKDQITGIGTLTYIDPESKVFASLGHEIADNKTGKIIDISKGFIFDSTIKGIIKSTPISTGEKRAIFNQNSINGIILKNTNKGIFGEYKSEINSDNLIEVGEIDEIELGPATIYTVLDNKEIQEFDINIIKINEDSETKNILFEITDEELMNNTNGVIKGMSGSPIVQNNKIIGAVTHAIINDNSKGYGIFVVKMLEEGDK